MKMLLFYVVLGSLLLSCATDRPTGKSEAEVLLKEAKELISDSRFLMATEKLNTLRSEHPYSYYATEAELLQADILFKQENFVEAAGAYILFKDFHPKNKKLEYVYFKIAESYFFQIPSSYDRDLSSAVEALKYFRELKARFPNSKYTKGGEEKVKKCQEMMEAKERYIADFYFKTEVYDAARHRYLDILKNFKTTSLRQHSILRVVETSLLIAKYSECVKYYNDFQP
jgi:outer membrane protein assembly factor BamD